MYYAIFKSKVHRPLTSPCDVAELIVGLLSLHMAPSSALGSSEAPRREPYEGQASRRLKGNTRLPDEGTNGDFEPTTRFSNKVIRRR